MLKCSLCPKEFTHQTNLTRHKKNVHQPKKFYDCPKCPVRVSRLDNMVSHMVKAHQANRDTANRLAKRLVPVDQNVSTTNPPNAPDISRKRPHDTPKEGSPPKRPRIYQLGKSRSESNLTRLKAKKLPANRHSPIKRWLSESDLGSRPEVAFVAQPYNVRSPDSSRSTTPDSPYSPRSPTPDYLYSPAPSDDDGPQYAPGYTSPIPETSPQPDDSHDQTPSRTPSPVAGPSHARTPSPVAGPSNLPDAWDPKDHYTVTHDAPLRNRRLKTEQRELRASVNPFESTDFPVIRERFRSILQSIIDTARSGADANSHGIISLSFKGIGKHVCSKFDNIHKITADDMMYKIEKVLNSNEEVSAEDFKIRVIFVEHPGGGRGEAPFHKRAGAELDPKLWIKRKHSILDVSDGAEDNMCLARCLVVGKHMADNPDTFRTTSQPCFSTLRKGTGAEQRNKAMRLHERAGVPTEEVCGMDELEKFQRILHRYQIVCYESFAGQTSVVFPVEQEIAKHGSRIYLWLFQNHFTLINPHLMAGFHGTAHFCHDCMQAFNGDGVHKCTKAVCRLCCERVCQNATSQPGPQPIHCDKCNTDFQSNHCFNAHRESKTCKRRYFCSKCMKFVPGNKKEPELHHCMMNYCIYCGEYYEPGVHKCYVQPPRKKKGEEPPVGEENEDIHYLLGEYEAENGYEDDNLDAEGNVAAVKEKTSFFADIESELNDKKHDPILLCMVSVDGKRYHYYGEDCLDKFLQDINNKDEFDNSTILFHNLSGYDGIHLLKLFYHHSIDCNPLFRGSRVLTMSLPKRKIKFVDTFLHIPIPLSKIPGCYGLPELSKGIFPYELCTKENRDYDGPFPAREFFDTKNMTPPQLKAFDAWYYPEKAKYDADPTKRFNLKEQMLAYCFDDCELARQGWMKHCETMMEMNEGVDPTNMITLPQYVNHVYRKLHMPKDSLAILPPRGYGQRGTQSLEALTWMLWLSKKTGVKIHHGRNGNEIKVGNFYLDGFSVDDLGKIAYEYNGCGWHGCPHCYHSGAEYVERLDMHGNQFTYSERHEKTQKKKQFLEDNGFRVISIYSCQFYQQQRDDPEMKEYVERMRDRLQRSTPLAPRASLRGGRTNCIRMYYKLQDGEIIKYMDFTSLYPSVNCCTEDDQYYPVGFPDILLDPDDFPPLAEIFGMMKCRILPPKQLLLPVLPVFEHDKVIFGLCGTCIKNGETTNKCTHNDEERCLEGDFVSLEIQKAVEMGYVIQEIFEIWQWGPDQRSKTLFRDQLIPAYTKKFQAGGWPKAYKTEEDRRELLDKYMTEQGIEIAYDSVYETRNAAETFTTKLICNNFWGYMCKNASGKVSTCTTYKQYLKLATDRTKKITNMWMANERLLYVETEDLIEYERVDPKTSVVVGTFTTCMARLKLFKAMETIGGDRVLYFDTDSVIWIQRPGLSELFPGSLLGELTDEIYEKHGERATITAFASGGPKTYALLVDDKETGERIDTVLRCKGIRLTSTASEQITAESLIELVKNNNVITVPQRTMKRNKQKGTIETKDLEKRLRVTFSKRLWPENVDDVSLPIGWQD